MCVFVEFLSENKLNVSGVVAPVNLLPLCIRPCLFDCLENDLQNFEGAFVPHATPWPLPSTALPMYRALCVEVVDLKALPSANTRRLSLSLMHLASYSMSDDKFENCWSKDKDNLGSVSWLAWANDTAAHYAVIHCKRRLCQIISDSFYCSNTTTHYWKSSHSASITVVKSVIGRSQWTRTQVHHKTTVKQSSSKISQRSAGKTPFRALQTKVLLSFRRNNKRVSSIAWITPSNRCSLMHSA